MKVLQILAPGFEEKEAMSIATVLMRGGCELLLAGVGSKDYIKGAHSISIGVKEEISKLSSKDFDAIILPGGLDGTMNNIKSPKVLELLKSFHEEGKIIGAICAAPMVIDAASISMAEFTCYPGCEANIKLSTNYNPKNVIKSGNIITGKGPAPSDEFALEVLAALCGEEKKAEVKAQMLFT